MSDDLDWRGPIFIVGASRSGTAMLHAILGRNPCIGLMGETHYFDDLRPRMAGKLISEMSEDERASCENYFRALTERPYGKQGDPEASWIESGVLLAEAATTGDDTDSLFEAFCKMYTKRIGAVIWGEKTPRHVFRIDDILEAFPQGKVICLVRDPRAVISSYRDWRYQGGLQEGENDMDYKEAIRADEDRARKSYNIVLASLMWRAATNAAFSGIERHGTDRVRVLRYEDITNEPEGNLKNLCNWLGVSFDIEMLEVPLHNSSTIEFDKHGGVSKEPQNRWRTALSQREINIVQKVTGKTMTVAGFAPIKVKESFLDVPLAFAKLPFAALRAARANRSRYSSLAEYAMRRLHAVLRN
jgi:hypothetical protein